MQHLKLTGLSAAIALMGSTALAQQTITAVHAFPETLV